MTTTEPITTTSSSSEEVTTSSQDILQFIFGSSENLNLPLSLELSSVTETTTEIPVTTTTPAAVDGLTSSEESAALTYFSGFMPTPIVKRAKKGQKEGIKGTYLVKFFCDFVVQKKQEV